MPEHQDGPAYPLGMELCRSDVAERPRKFAVAPSFDEIVRKYPTAFKAGILNGSAHGHDDLDDEARATIQFRVDQDLDDFFFNPRTGFRA